MLMVTLFITPADKKTDIFKDIEQQLSNYGTNKALVASQNRALSKRLIRHWVKRQDIQTSWLNAKKINEVPDKDSWSEQLCKALGITNLQDPIINIETLSPHYLLICAEASNSGKNYKDHSIKKDKRLAAIFYYLIITNPKATPIEKLKGLSSLLGLYYEQYITKPSDTLAQACFTLINKFKEINKPDVVLNNEETKTVARFTAEYEYQLNTQEANRRLQKIRTEQLTGAELQETRQEITTYWFDGYEAARHALKLREENAFLSNAEPATKTKLKSVINDLKHYFILSCYHAVSTNATRIDYYFTNLEKIKDTDKTLELAHRVLSKKQNKEKLEYQDYADIPVENTVEFLQLLLSNNLYRTTLIAKNDLPDLLVDIAEQYYFSILKLWTDYEKKDDPQSTEAKQQISLINNLSKDFVQLCRYAEDQHNAGALSSTNLVQIITFIGKTALRGLEVKYVDQLDPKYHSAILSICGIAFSTITQTKANHYETTHPECQDAQRHKSYQTALSDVNDASIIEEAKKTTASYGMAIHKIQTQMPAEKLNSLLPFMQINYQFAHLCLEKSGDTNHRPYLTEPDPIRALEVFMGALEETEKPYEENVLNQEYKGPTLKKFSKKENVANKDPAKKEKLSNRQIRKRAKELFETEAAKTAQTCCAYGKEDEAVLSILLLGAPTTVRPTVRPPNSQVVETAYKLQEKQRDHTTYMNTILKLATDWQNNCRYSAGLQTVFSAVRKKIASHYRKPPAKKKNTFPLDPRLADLWDKLADYPINETNYVSLAEYYLHHPNAAPGQAYQLADFLLEWVRNETNLIPTSPKALWLTYILNLNAGKHGFREAIDHQNDSKQKENINWLLKAAIQKEDPQIAQLACAQVAKIEKDPIIANAWQLLATNSENTPALIILANYYDDTTVEERKPKPEIARKLYERIIKSTAEPAKKIHAYIQLGKTQFKQPRKLTENIAAVHRYFDQAIALAPESEKTQLEIRKIETISSQIPVQKISIELTELTNTLAQPDSLSNDEKQFRIYNSISALTETTHEIVDALLKLIPTSSTDSDHSINAWQILLESLEQLKSSTKHRTKDITSIDRNEFKTKLAEISKQLQTFLDKNKSLLEAYVCNQKYDQVTTLTKNTINYLAEIALNSKDQNAQLAATADLITLYKQLESSGHTANAWILYKKNLVEKPFVARCGIQVFYENNNQFTNTRPDALKIPTSSSLDPKLDNHSLGRKIYFWIQKYCSDQEQQELFNSLEELLKSAINPPAKTWPVPTDKRELTYTACIHNLIISKGFMGADPQTRQLAQDNLKAQADQGLNMAVLEYSYQVQEKFTNAVQKNWEQRKEEKEKNKETWEKKLKAGRVSKISNAPKSPNINIPEAELEPLYNFILKNKSVKNVVVEEAQLLLLSICQKLCLNGNQIAEKFQTLLVEWSKNSTSNIKTRAQNIVNYQLEQQELSAVKAKIPVSRPSGFPFKLFEKFKDIRITFDQKDKRLDSAKTQHEPNNQKLNYYCELLATPTQSHYLTHEKLGELIQMATSGSAQAQAKILLRDYIFRLGTSNSYCCKIEKPLETIENILKILNSDDTNRNQLPNTTQCVLAYFTNLIHGQCDNLIENLSELQPLLNIIGSKETNEHETAQRKQALTLFEEYCTTQRYATLDNKVFSFYYKVIEKCKIYFSERTPGNKNIIEKLLHNSSKKTKASAGILDDELNPTGYRKLADEIFMQLKKTAYAFIAKDTNTSNSKTASKDTEFNTEKTKLFSLLKQFDSRYDGLGYLYKHLSQLHKHLYIFNMPVYKNLLDLYCREKSEKGVAPNLEAKRSAAAPTR